MGVLDVGGRTRARRARWIVDLRDMIDIARKGARSWVSPDEFALVWKRGRSWWQGDWQTPRRALFRLQAELYKIHCAPRCVDASETQCSCGVAEIRGVLLKIETPRDGGGTRVYVATQEISHLIDPWIREAVLIDERLSAKHEGREPDLEDLDPELTVQELVNDYRVKKQHLGTLSRKYGTGQELLRAILVANKVEIRAKRKMRITDHVGPKVVEEALRVHDAGGSLRDVQRVLKCSTRSSALRLLRAHGRRLPVKKGTA